MASYQPINQHIARLCIKRPINTPHGFVSSDQETLRMTLYQAIKRHSARLRIKRSSDTPHGFVSSDQATFRTALCQGTTLVVPKTLQKKPGFSPCGTFFNRPSALMQPALER
jgi:hypothetical protein